MVVSSLKTAKAEKLYHSQIREDLACAFRWAARLNMHEGIANHFSAVVNATSTKFLINPYGKYFSRISASDLLLLDTGTVPEEFGDAIDQTAYCIHGSIHRNQPRARCILHLHPKYATALSALKDTSIPPIDQTTMRFYNRVTVDNGYNGMGLGNEAERLSKKLGNGSVLLMGQHGVITVGETVAQAFDELFYFERACKTLFLALSSGREMNIASHEVAEKTARQWESYPRAAEKHFNALKEILDEEEPEYRY
ncbi:MAG: Decarboxylase NovR [Alphaproteobacteria bacterium MarineAlpha3_Bin5]|nr:MAG: Decarboxylase NovR [Alphaproteobacteria bacterium MarineAlpha3_Bin5]|tara:strand:- start:368 stop:1126 length:759 start_codon:yes stop_codon:yes gene_type:complete